MANTNAPRGFRFLRMQGGGSMPLAEYTIAVNNSTPIYYGDPVEMTGTGRNIQVAAATNQDNLGIFQGCHYTNSKGEPKFSPNWTGEAGATSIFASVIDDLADSVFEIQSSVTNEADVGQLADWSLGTGNTATGMSGAYLVGNTLATTAKACRILGLSGKPGNEYGQYAKVEVKILASVMDSMVSTVGGN